MGKVGLSGIFSEASSSELDFHHLILPFGASTLFGHSGTNVTHLVGYSDQGQRSGRIFSPFCLPRQSTENLFLNTGF